MSDKNSFITQAFKQFGEILDEELDTELSVQEVPVYTVDDTAHEFLDTAGEEPVDVIDLEAETVEDLKQSYVGKVVLDCNVCHSNIFIDKDEVTVDEDGVANVDMECPYCISTEGYTIIGKIAPYEDDEEEIEIEEEPEDEIEIEEVEPEEELEEGLISKKEHAKGYADVYSNVAKGITTDSEADAVTDELDKQLKENCDEEIEEGCKSKDINESIEDVTITTDEETMTMTTKEDGGIAVETTPLEPDTEIDIEDETFEEPALEGDEMIAPIDDEETDEIELNSEVDALSNEDIETLEEPDEIDIEDFDEEPFDELGESYLTKHYDNVEGFKTVNAKVLNNSLIIEGVIRFNSGNSKCTSFVFEASKFNAKTKSALFEGYNRQISRGKKTFKMNCLVESGKVTPRKLTYNYRTKNELNESVRVNGTCNVEKK